MKRAAYKSRVIHIDTVRNVPYNMGSEREQNVIGSRIKEARQKVGMNLDEFSERLNDYGVVVGRGGLNKWEIGATVPNAYQLVALMHALGITDSLDYFTGSYRPDLNDEGIAKVASYKADLVASGRYRPEPVVAAVRDNIEYIKIPVSNLCVSAGTGNFLDEGNFELISFPATAVPARADFGIRVSGDSMEPAYHDGQIAWVEQCNQLRVGEVGVFIYDNEGYLKAYGEQTPDEEFIDAFTDSDGSVRPQPILISFNQAYAPRPISPSYPFQIIGRVL